MRDDMFKVIVERPRHGVGSADRIKLRRMRGADRSRIGVKRQVAEQSHSPKFLNENLAPLKRYLMRQRGRKWDDVFSDICQTLDTGSTVKMHVRGHIKDFIMFRVMVDRDGNWFGTPEGSGPRPPDEWGVTLYVDPFDGRIRETRDLCRELGLVYYRYGRPWYAHPILPSELVWFDETGFYLALNGGWFKIILDFKPFEEDHEIAGIIRRGDWRNDLSCHVVYMKQLSKKEIRDLKLGQAKETRYAH